MTYSTELGEMNSYQIEGDYYIPWTEYYVTISTETRQGFCKITSNEESKFTVYIKYN